MTEAVPRPEERDFLEDLEWSESVPRSVLYPLYRAEYGFDFREDPVEYRVDPAAQRCQRDWVHTLLGDPRARVFYIEEKFRRFEKRWYTDVLAEVEHVGDVERRGSLFNLRVRNPHVTLSYIRFWKGVPSFLDLIDSEPFKRLALGPSYVGRHGFLDCSCRESHREGSPDGRCVECGSMWTWNHRGATRWCTRALPIRRRDVVNAGCLALGTRQTTFSRFLTQEGGW